MKQYPKVYDNVSLRDPGPALARIGSAYGSVDELIARFRSFYRQAHQELFNMMVKEVWLSQQILYKGARRKNRQNGFGVDWAYSVFMTTAVGISQKPLTTGLLFDAIPTYFKDFFPNFTDHDPFLEPKYFAYPYKHVTLDHLLFVYQCHNRLEMLEEAETRSMKIKEFQDWVVNWVSCYNDEVPLVEVKGSPEKRKKYELTRNSFLLYIRCNG